MILDDILDYNAEFVKNENYKPYETDPFPTKKLVIFTCMDARLLELLHRALNLENGDAKIVKNSGAIIRKPFDSVVKSILVSIYNLKAETVLVIGHHDCGMFKVDTTALKAKMVERGITQEMVDAIENAGIDLDEEFHGFNTVEESVEQSVHIIRNHPLLPKEIKVHGLVIDPSTGKIDIVDRDDE